MNFLTLELPDSVPAFLVNMKATFLKADVISVGFDQSALSN
ncbi:hypothetical protein N9E34_03605 [Opitutales bacterium]|nr:hypothetical protein [Opitutales bacterium]